MSTTGGSGRTPAAPRCLWLSGTCPHPVDGGLASYSAGLSEALARAGAEIEGLALVPTEVGAAADAIADITETTVVRDTVAADTAVRWTTVDARRRPQSASLLSPLPNIAHSYAVAPYRAALAEALDRGPWDAVILDHLQMGWAFDVVRRWRDRHAAPTRIVHVSHNHEESARREIAAASRVASLRGLALRLDAVKITHLERRLVEGVDLLTAITPDDEARFGASGRAANRVVIEPGYEGERVERVLDEQVPRRVAILANLDWHVKRSNLDRFLVEADHRFAAAGIELLVIGKAPADYVEAWSSRLRATRFVGFVNDVAATLASARLGIVSEPSGGGFKLKSLDYVFHRVPMAVLDGSVAGLPLVPGVDYLTFPDEAALAEGIVAAIDDLPALGRLQDGAYRAADAGFSWDERGRRLLEAIATVPSGSAAPEQGKGSSAVNPTVSRRGVGANPAPEAVRPT